MLGGACGNGRQSVGRRLADKNLTGSVTIAGNRVSDLHFLW